MHSAILRISPFLKKEYFFVYLSESTECFLELFGGTRSLDLLLFRQANHFDATLRLVRRLHARISRMSHEPQSHGNGHDRRTNDTSYKQ